MGSLREQKVLGEEGQGYGNAGFRSKVSGALPGPFQGRSTAMSLASLPGEGHSVSQLLFFFFFFLLRAPILHL